MTSELTLIPAHITDSRGVYLRTVQVDPMAPQPSGAVYAELPDEIYGFTRMWVVTAWEQVPDVDVPDFPASQEAQDVSLRITKLAFRSRFTIQEKASIEFAALDDPSSDIAARMQSAALRAYLKDLEAATFIDLADTALVDGVSVLVSAGVLSQDRVSDILRKEVGPSEAY